MVEEIMILVGCIMVGAVFLWALIQSAEVLLFPLFVSIAAVPPLVYILCMYTFAGIEYDGAHLRTTNCIGRTRSYNVSQLDPSQVSKVLRRSLRAHYVYKVEMVGAEIKWNGLLVR